MAVPEKKSYMSFDFSSSRVIWPLLGVDNGKQALYILLVLVATFAATTNGIVLIVYTRGQRETTNHHGDQQDP